MTVPGGASSLLLSSAADAGGYEISRSVRFNSSDSAYCSRVFSSAGNRKTWTWSGWVKRAKLGAQFYLFGTTTDSFNNNFGLIWVSNADKILFQDYSGGAERLSARTAAVFRDPSAWLHLVVTVDTTQATAANRVKIYVNGVEQALDSFNFGSQNTDLFINTTNTHYISFTSSVVDGYLADIHFIDGQALTPSSFTEVSATTGQLVPKAYSGTYGTNGFHLDFADNSNNTATTLGKDTSGNNNDWTPFNLQTTTGGPTSVAAASGALPIYNTTDTYGTTKGSGTRTDSNSSSIVLAVPMDGSNGGTTFTDESATIKGSGSAKTINRFGNTSTSTSQAKYYGSSGYFDGAGDYLSVSNSADFAFGTSDFTIEWWAWVPSAEASNLLPIFDNDYQGTGGICCAFRQSDSLLSLGPNGGGVGLNYCIFRAPFALETWNHFAVVAHSGVYKGFINGVQCSLNSGNTAVVNVSRSSGNVEIGRIMQQTSFDLGAYVNDFRIYKGVAKYTSNFNPPSSTQNPTVAAGFDTPVDTPTSYGTDTGAGGEVRGNYATLNPVNSDSNTTLSNGNLDLTRSTGSWGSTKGTFGISSGKYYWEWTCNNSTTSASTGQHIIGIGTNNASISTYPGSDANGYGYSAHDGRKYNNQSGGTGTGTTYGSSWTSGDVIGVAFDADNGNLYFYKNGVVQNSGTAAFTGLTSGPYLPMFGVYGLSTTATGTLNAGQRPFAYTAPSGYKALCDTNLAAPVVAQPSTVMDVALYTGNGGTQTISGLGFSPDLVWLKGRSVAYNHFLADSVRGISNELVSNTTSAEATYSDKLTALNSDGFSLGSNSTGATINNNGTTYVAWTWDAGTSTATNTDGSITSTVRANASAGFSVVTYSSGSTNATVGHGLGVAPGLIIAKSRTNAVNWVVYHSSLGKDGYLHLDLTNAFASNTNYWGIVGPNSTTFGLATSGFANNSGNMVAYCFAPVAGYSSFGSYVGNGSATDGPFVYTGFRPRWVMIKRTDSTANWRILDTARDTYNVASKELYPSLSNAEGSFSALDINSNGFKVRTSDPSYNASAGNYIFASFAEFPFAYSRAR